MSRVLLKEIRNVGLLTLTMGTMQFIIASVVGYFGLPALWGTLLGCAIAIANFALMGIILELCMHGKGAAAGFAAGMIVLLIYVATRRTIRKPGDFKTLLNIPCLGVIPVFRVKKRRKKTKPNSAILCSAPRCNTQLQTVVSFLISKKKFFLG